MLVLVTGATGFVGWHTAARLRRSGHRVRALVRDRDKALRALGRLGLGADDLVVGDMTDRAAVEQALDGAVAVVHAAAAISLDARDARRQLHANVTGARHVVGGACDRGIDAVLFVSSLTALFDPRAAEITGDSPLAENRSGYGRSKTESDRLVRELQAGGAPVATVYPSAVIGPDDPGLSESVRAFRGFLKATLRTTGGVQFVDARDLAEFNVRLLERGTRGRHVMAGHFLAWDDLTRLLERVSGAHIRRFPAPAPLLRTVGRAVDLLKRFVDTDLIMTREAMEVATLWRPIADSAAVAELRVAPRDPAETLADMLRWLHAAGRLPSRAIPRLVGDRAAA
jgi:nucleoside-diphosphate-sugar epimerase